jgi:hypothetical protein
MQTNLLMAVLNLQLNFASLFWRLTLHTCTSDDEEILFLFCSHLHLSGSLKDDRSSCFSPSSSHQKVLKLQHRHMERRRAKSDQAAAPSHGQGKGKQTVVRKATFVN